MTASVDGADTPDHPRTHRGDPKSGHRTGSDQRRTDPNTNHTYPSRTDPSRTGQGHADPNHADPNRTGQGHADPSRTEQDPPRPSYTGPDRRHRVGDADARAYLSRTALTVAVVVGVWAILASFAVDQSPHATQSLIVMTRSLCGALFAASAALMFAAWRITGTARPAWSVVALALVGFAIPAVGMIDSVTGVNGQQSVAAGLVRALVKFAVIAVGVAALRSPAVDARIRPARTVLPFLVAGALITIVVVATDIETAAADSLGTVVTVMQSVAAAGFGALTVAFVRAGLPQQRGSAQRNGTRRGVSHRRRYRNAEFYIAGGFSLLALGTAGHAIAGPLSPRQELVGAGFTLLLATAVAAACALVLWRLHTSQGTRLLSVAGELQGSKKEVADLESDQARRLHDARNAIFAISGATSILARPDRTPDIDVAHLEGLVMVELDRLGHLLDRDFRPAPRRYTIREIVEPLAAAYCAQGTKITVDIAPGCDSATLFGATEPIANAITNILTNARIHAPGAHVWITARDSHDGVSVQIADDGPGIPFAQQSSVVLPGVRGTGVHGTGSGLGLASASQALSVAHGTLQLSDRTGGGTTVTLWVPAGRRDGEGVAP